MHYIGYVIIGYKKESKENQKCRSDNEIRQPLEDIK